MQAIKKGTLSQVFFCEFWENFFKHLLKTNPGDCSATLAIGNIAPYPQIFPKTFLLKYESHVLIFSVTVWKVSKYGVISGPYLDAFHGVSSWVNRSGFSFFFRSIFSASSRGNKRSVVMIKFFRYIWITA